MMNRMFPGGRISVLPIAWTVGVTLALVAPAAAFAAASGVCITTQVSSPFRLPDGVLRPAGTLTLCDTASFTPVSDLHVLLVDGRRIGMFLSRRRTTEAPREIRPEVVFDRDSEGSLDLVGYILPASGRSVAYRLKPLPSNRAAEARTWTGAGSAPMLAVVMTAGVH